MRYIDLFAGVGGFRYGIEKAFNDKYSERLQQGVSNGNSTNTRESLMASKPLCVYSNEWDKYANSVYKKHYGECDSRDIRDVKAGDIPGFDLLVGGFPCQSFSVAGKRGGFNDTRGTLFFEIARIVKQKQPRYLLLENVKGLLSHDKGGTFATIITTLDELGYDVQWQVLNSKNFGVPQSRERIFIIGHLRGETRPEVFPILESNKSSIIQLNYPRHSNNRIYDNDGLSPTLNTMQGGMRQPKIAVPVLTPDRAKKRQNGRRMKTPGEPSFTLTKQDIHGIYDGAEIRRLTPLECERLQGFPDNWTKHGDMNVPISDTQRYKMMGNAVTTTVITAIFNKLILSKN